MDVVKYIRFFSSNRVYVLDDRCLLFSSAECPDTAHNEMVPQHMPVIETMRRSVQKAEMWIN